MTAEMLEIQEARIQKALHLIKLHITEDSTPQNIDLHEVVQAIVTFARSENRGYCSR
jgi:hypothetical protein